MLSSDIVVVMAYRAILRFSFDGDDGSAQRNRIVPRLERLGFVNIGTATWNCSALAPGDVGTYSAIVNDIMTVAATTKGQVRLDHIWSYVDIPDAR